MNIIRVLIYWHSYVHHGGFNLVHITYQVHIHIIYKVTITYHITYKVSHIHITYQVSVAVFGILVGPAVMFVMLQAGLSEVCTKIYYLTKHLESSTIVPQITGLESYISSIIISLPIFVLALAARFGNQEIQTWVVLLSSGIFALLFIVTFLYELITGFIDLCFTSMIVITYSMVFGSYLIMTVLHPR